MSHQYTDNFLRVPAEYPPDQVWSNFDPYLDGDYTPPLGDEVALYLIEPKLESFFVGTNTLSALNSVFTLSGFIGTGGYKLALSEVSLFALEAQADAFRLDGQTALSSLETSGVAPDEPFSVNFNNARLNIVFGLAELAGQGNISIMEHSFETAALIASTTNGSVETETTLAELEGAYSLAGLDTSFTLKE